MGLSAGQSTEGITLVDSHPQMTASERDPSEWHHYSKLRDQLGSFRREFGGTDNRSISDEQ